MKHLKMFVAIAMECIKRSKRKSIASIIISLIYAFISISVTYVIQIFIERCSNTDIMQCLLMSLFLGITIIFSQCSMTLNIYYSHVAYLDMKKTLNKIFYEKVKKISTEDFERSDVLDLLNKAQNGIDGYLSVFSLLQMLFFFYIPYFIGMEVYLYNLHQDLACIVVIIFVPEVVAQIVKVKYYSSLEDKTVQLVRNQKIIEDSIIGKEYFKATRVNNAFDFLFKKLSSNMDLLGNKRRETERKSAICEIGLKTITILGQLYAIILLLRSVAFGRITIGAFTAVFEAILLITAYIEEIVCVYFGSVTKKVGLIRNYNLFLCYQSTQPKYTQCQEDLIRFNQLSYHYPMNPSWAVKNIDFEIKKGETVAIVGYNGAGKTTLAKIALGLLQPTDGTVYFGKTFLRNGRLSCTALFQNYQKYKLSVKDNITISNHFFEDNDALKKLVKTVKLELKSFPNGMETVLAAEFGGIEISGGIWQRISLARALYKPHKLIVLDEPTASIDPMEENRLYKTIKSICNDTTVLIITHRIGAAQLADNIIVLNDGSIAEHGSHKELLQQKGQYYQMFYEQAKWYQLEHD